jgi:hypothetical protein
MYGLCSCPDKKKAAMRPLLFIGRKKRFGQLTAFFRYAALPLVNKLTIARTTIEPPMATSKLQKLKPSTPLAPI